MTITPTALLSLPIITTGTESGTWGDVVDNGLTSYLDIAIAGGLSIAITTADVTLTKTAGTSSATGIVSTTAQYAILNITGAKTAARNLNLPISSKQYTINNAGTGGFLLTVRGVTPTTGVTLVDGEKAIVAWNGTDYVKITSSVITALTGTLPVANGGTGSTSTTFVNLTTNVTGTLPVANGGTGATTFTANNVLLGNGTSALQVVAPGTSGNILTSNGTTWQSTTPASGLPSQTGNAGKYLTTDGTNSSWAVVASDSTQTLTDGATVNWATGSGNIATLTLGGNRTMAAPTGLTAKSYILVVNQDATGSRTITWNAVFKWPGGALPVLSTAANAKDVFSFFSDGTNMYGTYLRGVA